jgi:hypothetical protein
MTSPVSNAIQGAYVVAAIITGLIFGAVSIVFTEVTEGLGCLFGGFCLGMWILVLKPGGLVTSTGGRAILIVAFCLSFFALSFTRYTRSYGLIAGTSFGGATVVVLGIDCFSRAGLKEFWLYIWSKLDRSMTLPPRSNNVTDLNSDLFPLNTNTYPHTRGIRVEIAAIIIIFLMGLTSQLKLWKVIKERREKRAALQREDGRNLEEEEANVGQRVERSTNRDRAQWEAVYGNKDRANEYHADSGIGEDMDSIKKDDESLIESREIHELHDNGIELEEMEESPRPDTGILSKRTSKELDGNSIVVRVARDLDTCTVDDYGNAVSPHDARISPRPSPRPSRRNSRSGNDMPRMASVPEHEPTGVISKRSSIRSAAPPIPTHVPLPFAVPTQQVETDGDESSIATFADSDHEDVPPVPVRNSQRNSRDSAFQRPSFGKRSTSTPTEAVVIPHDDDGASSVAATVDGHTDDGKSDTAGETAAVSPETSKDQEQKSDPDSVKDQPKATTALTMAALASVGGEIDKSKETITASSQHPESIADSDMTAKTPKVKSNGKSERASTLAPSEVNHEAEELPETSAKQSLKPPRSRAPSDISGKHSSFHESLNAQFPARLSKVVMTYRTNEWAKHLTSAERPEVEDIELAPVEDGYDEGPREPPAPVVVEELQQTPINAIPPPAHRSISHSIHNHTQSHPLARSDSTLSRVSLPNSQSRARLSTYPSIHSIYHAPVQRSLSQVSFPNSSSPNMTQSSVSLPAQTLPAALNTRAFRSATDLLSQPLLESPVEDSARPSRSLSRVIPSPSPHHTLMGKRESLIKNRFSTANVQLLTPNPDSVPSLISSPNDSLSVLESRYSAVEDDDVPLAQRRALIRRGSSIGSSVGHSTYLSSQHGGIASPQDLTFDSHQPKRDSGPTQDKRELMLASWRESMRQDLASSVQPKIEVEARREEMLTQQRQSLVKQQQKEHDRVRRTSIIDDRMRKGDMMELHKEAIRKMQATANQHA